MKADITHSAMEIDLQTTDHVLAMETVPEQYMSTKCFVCNIFQAISDFIMVGTEKLDSSYYSLSYWDKLPSYHVVTRQKVAEQHILTKCSKCNTFQVTSDSLNSENLKISIAKLCYEVQVCNFTMF